MGTLQDDTALTARDGKLFVTLSQDWNIWGPNGGYVAAIALRAAGKVAPAGHRPSSISVQYLSVGKFEECEGRAGQAGPLGLVHQRRTGAGRQALPAGAGLDHRPQHRAEHERTQDARGATAC
jgi:hypothetical protein